MASLGPDFTVNWHNGPSWNAADLPVCETYFWWSLQFCGSNPWRFGWNDSTLDSKAELRVADDFCCHLTLLQSQKLEMAVEDDASNRVSEPCRPTNCPRNWWSLSSLILHYAETCAISTSAIVWDRLQVEQRISKRFCLRLLAHQEYLVSCVMWHARRGKDGRNTAQRYFQITRTIYIESKWYHNISQNIKHWLETAWISRECSLNKGSSLRWRPAMYGLELITKLPASKYQFQELYYYAVWYCWFRFMEQIWRSPVEVGSFSSDFFLNELFFNIPRFSCLGFPPSTVVSVFWATETDPQLRYFRNSRGPLFNGLDSQITPLISLAKKRLNIRKKENIWLIWHTVDG